MRTITKNFFKHLDLQQKEAEIQGLTSIAESLSDQVNKYSSSVRENTDNEFYIYKDKDFHKDVEKSIWDAVIRTADFYDIRRLDVVDVAPLIEATAAELIQSIRNKYGFFHGVGAHEETVPGELGKVSIEVEE